MAREALKERRPSRRQQASFLRRAILELLEIRSLLSAAHDITGITAIRADSMFSGIDGSGITIALFDSGVYADNPDLKGNFLGYVNAISPADPTALVLTTNPSIADQDAQTSGEGHGSHTAGIAASTNPEIGAATGAKFISIRNLPNPGEQITVSDQFHPGMQWVLQNAAVYNIKVVNISEGVYSVNSNDPVAQALQEGQLAADILSLENAGIAVVVSSGNNYAQFANPTNPAAGLGNSSPAVLSKIAVGNTIADSIDPSTLNQPFGGGGPDYYAVSSALGQPDQLEATSQRSNLSNQLFAPGDNIFSTWLGSEHKNESGTSMSAPLVAGIVALMQEEAYSISHTYLSVSTIANILQSTADNIVDLTVPTNFRFSAATFTSVGVLPTTGLTFKRVNAYKALQLIHAMFDLPPGQQFISTSGPVQVLPDLTGTEAFDVTGSIVHSNDVNLYKVSLNEIATFKLYLTLPVNGGNATFLTMRLFDSNGVEIQKINGKLDSSSTLKLETDVNTPLPMGTYYIGISSQGNDTYDPVAGNGADNGFFTGDYRINVNVINPDPNGVIAGAGRVDLTTPTGYTNRTTPLNTASHMTAFNRITGQMGVDPAVPGSVDNGNVNVDNGDVDMFLIQAPDDGKILLSSTVSGMYLRVFTADTSGAYTEIANIGSGTSLTLTTQLGVIYYVGVSRTNNKVYDPTDPYSRPVNSSPHTASTAYGLTLIFDNGDLNGSRLTATNATVGQSISATIGTDSGKSLTHTVQGTTGDFTKDVDWYKLTISGNGILDIKVGTSSTFTPDIGIWTGPTNAASTTSSLRIADSAGGGDLAIQVTAGEVLYVTMSDLKNNNMSWDRLASGSGGGTGDYTLTTALLGLSSLKTLNNNSILFGTPTSVPQLGHSVEGNIGLDGSFVEDAKDIDLYTFRAPTNGVVTLSTLTQTEGDANTVIRVFDSNGVPLVSSQDQTFKSLGGKVNIAVTGGQTYFVGITGAAFDKASYNPVDGTGGQTGSTGHYRLSFSNVAAPPVRVLIASQPTGVVSGQPMNPPITVNVVDSGNKAVNGDASTVTLTIVSGPTGGVLGGTTSVQATDGVAVFNALTFSKPGSYTLQASDGALITANTNPFNVSLPPSKLVVTTQPATTAAGGTFGLTVSVEDVTGVIVGNDTSSITISIFSGPTNGTLIGTATVAASGGVATFTGLSLTASGTYVLSIVDGSLTEAQSNLIITADAATSRLALLHPSTTAVVGKPFGSSLVFAVEDQFGNVVVTDKSKVALSLVSGPSGGTLTGTTLVTVSNGLATFSNAILSIVGDYTLSALDTALSIATPVQALQTITPGVTTAAAPKVAASYIYGNAITFSGTFKSSAPTNLAFSGNALIIDAGNNVLGTATLAANGGVKFVLTGITTGSYTCTLNYAGDTNHTGVTSSQFTLVVNQASTTTAVTSSLNALVFGQQLTLTASVKATGGAAATARTGTVTFFDGVNEIGSPVALNGSSSAAITFSPAAGPHAFKAVYSGDALFKSSISPNLTRAVGKDKTTILLTPSNPGPIVHGTSIDLGIQVTVVLPGVGIPSGTVTIKDGSKVLGTLTLGGAGSGTLAGVTFTASGSHSLTAIYAGDISDNPATSPVVKLTVT